MPIETLSRLVPHLVLGLAIGCGGSAARPDGHPPERDTEGGTGEVPPDASPSALGGHFVLVGGGSRPESVMRLFVRLGGGADGRFVVFPLASADEDTGDFYERELRGYGARHVETVQIGDRRDAMNPARVDTVRRATAVWFSGGDQSRIAARLVDTPMLEALREMHAAGGVIGGTSAGTACQSDPMLVGSGDEDVIRRDNIATARGLGLLRGVILDQHFIARRRQNRLLSVVLEHPSLVGIGVDEATAIWAAPDGTLEVVGEGTVAIYDARDARVTEGEALGAVGIRHAILVPGQRYDLGRAELAAP